MASVEPPWEIVDVIVKNEKNETVCDYRKIANIPLRN